MDKTYKLASYAMDKIIPQGAMICLNANGDAYMVKNLSAKVIGHAVHECHYGNIVQVTLLHDDMPTETTISPDTGEKITKVAAPGRSLAVTFEYEDGTTEKMLV